MWWGIFWTFSLTSQEIIHQPKWTRSHKLLVLMEIYSAISDGFCWGFAYDSRFGYQSWWTSALFSRYFFYFCRAIFYSLNVSRAIDPWRRGDFTLQIKRQSVDRDSWNSLMFIAVERWTHFGTEGGLWILTSIFCSWVTETVLFSHGLEECLQSYLPL